MWLGYPYWLYLLCARLYYMGGDQPNMVVEIRLNSNKMTKYTTKDRKWTQ